MRYQGKLQPYNTNLLNNTHLTEIVYTEAIFAGVFFVIQLQTERKIFTLTFLKQFLIKSQTSL